LPKNARLSRKALLKAAYRLYKRRYPAPAFDSVRQSEVDRLKKAMQVIDPEKQQFIVFYGPRGVGKSTSVATRHPEP